MNTPEIYLFINTNFSNPDYRFCPKQRTSDSNASIALSFFTNNYRFQDGKSFPLSVQ
jgi:hypothetical protein